MNKKIRETEDSKKELDLKKNEYEEHLVRLKGGYSKGQKKDIMSVDEEINRLKKLIELRTIEKDNYVCLEQPKMKFQANPRWIQIANELDMEKFDKEITCMQESLGRNEKQKTTILETLPILRARINELEKKLGLEQTKFETEKADYIG